MYEGVEDSVLDGAVWVEPSFYAPHHRNHFGADEEIIDMVLDAAASAADQLGVGVGVMGRSGGTPVPNMPSPDARKQPALPADPVVNNTAGSGQYVQSMFEKRGIASQIQAKTTRPANAAQTMDRILQGKGNEIGFGLISEIKPYEEKGVRYVGPLPAAGQNYTNYEAIISPGSKVSDAAKEFIRFLTTPAAKQAFGKTGVD